MNVSSLSLGNLMRAAKDPEFRQTGFKLVNRAANRQTKGRLYDVGVDVIEEDWDNLIILDACRFDTFEEQHSFDGDLQPIVSKGSTSWEFVRRNFGDKRIHDTLYVSSNYHYMKLDENPFFYSETVNRLYPQKLMDRAQELHSEYPHKRLIVHFMVPHAPYHSQEAQHLRREITEQTGKRFALSDCDEGKAETVSDEWDLYSLLSASREGFLSDKKLRDLYQENVDLAAEYASALTEQLTGKTVITSDHGEALGERLPPLFVKEYGHNEGIYCQGMRSVPWLEMDGENRRNIRSETPITSVEEEEEDDESLNDRLRALGYKE